MPDERKSPTAAVLRAGETLLLLAAEQVRADRDVEARDVIQRAALLLETVNHPDVRDIAAGRGQVQLLREGVPEAKMDIVTALEQDAWRLGRDARYFQGVVEDPRQATAGSRIEEQDHPWHEPDPWAGRAIATHYMHSHERVSGRARWRDDVIASEKTSPVRRELDAASEAARIASAGTGPMVAVQAHTRASDATKATRNLPRSVHRDRAEVDR